MKILPILIQAFVMLGDVMLVIASVYLIMVDLALGIVICSIAFPVWKSQGGSMAWKKENRKMFFQNWDKLTSE